MLGSWGGRCPAQVLDVFRAPGLKARPEEDFWSTLRGLLWPMEGVLLGLRRPRDLGEGDEGGCVEAPGWSGVTSVSGPRGPAAGAGLTPPSLPDHRSRILGENRLSWDGWAGNQPCWAGVGARP